MKMDTMNQKTNDSHPSDPALQPAAPLRERAGTIRLLARERESLRAEAETCQSDLKDIQKRTAQSVEMEYNATGIKELSNAEKRKRSVEEKLERHTSYQKLTEEEKTLHTHILMQGIELSYQRRLFFADLAELLKTSPINKILSGERS